jgi:hypothetical protein
MEGIGYLTVRKVLTGKIRATAVQMVRSLRSVQDDRKTGETRSISLSNPVNLENPVSLIRGYAWQAPRRGTAALSLSSSVVAPLENLCGPRAS